MSKITFRWSHCLLLDYNCRYNPARYNCKLSDAIDKIKDVLLWIRPIAGKIIAQTSIVDICVQNGHANAEIVAKFSSQIKLQLTVHFS